MDDVIRITIPIVAIGVIAYGLVRAAYRRRDPSSAKPEELAGITWRYDRLIRVQNIASDPKRLLSLGMRLQISDRLIRIAAPSWQYVRGVSDDWRVVPSDARLKRLSPTVLELVWPADRLQIRSRNVPDIEVELSSVGVQRANS